MTAMTGSEPVRWDEDTIHQHPMWADQVRLEQYMQREGADQVTVTAIKAKKRGQMTRLKPMRHLLNEWAPKVSESIKAWVHGTRLMQRSHQPIALRYIEAMDYDRMAVVGLRAVLDGVTSKHVKVLSLAKQIGLFLEHEEQIRAWEKDKPELFKSVQAGMDRDNSTDQHRAIVNVFKFNKLMDEGKLNITWTPWGDQALVLVGVEVLNAIIRATGWFDYGDDPFHQVAGKSPAKVVLPRPMLLDWLASNLDSMEKNAAAYMPCVVPPKRWNGVRKGGYYTPYVRTPNLIRFHVSQDDQRENAFDDYDAMEMPAVYDALHFLQEVPWRVNRRVYDVAQQMIHQDARQAGLPRFAPGVMPRKPWEGMSKTKASEWIKSHPEEHKAWKQAARPIYKQDIEDMATRRGPARTMKVALQFLDHVFYFPHMMDFRGRMYPIPVGLQPQGDDLARGLLHFADGKPITEENGGVDWLAIHLASCWGNDKVSFEDRITWVRERDADWRLVASDPLGYANLWADSDKPFQTLACIFEWVGYLEHGEGFISHVPVSVDGTCNGIQHLSAMTRDEVAGKYVNLVPGDKPQDIYKFVADTLRSRILDVSETSCGLRKEQADYWLAMLGADWSRKLTKRQVMVVPYGGTRQSFFDYTRAWIKETIFDKTATLSGPNGPLWSTEHKDVTEAEQKERAGNLTFLAMEMYETVTTSVVAGGVTVMKWLQECAKVASKGNQPIFWPVATGFKVRHFYGRTLEKAVHLKLDGHSTSLKMHVVTDVLDLKSQLKGIPPNFVHSQDAAAMTLCINRARHDGVTAFTAVHDAFGTHACDMHSLAVRLREAFVEVHMTPGGVLSDFRNACLAIVRDVLVSEEHLDPLEAAEKADDMLPQLPTLGSLDLEGILASDYFFA